MGAKIPRWTRRGAGFLVAGLTAALLVVAGAGPTPSQAEQKEKETYVTVYNGGFGLVRQIMAVSLPQGESRLEMTEVAARLEPPSVKFAPLGGSGFTVLEQNFDYDLVGSEKLLSKYIGKTIGLRSEDGTLRQVKLLAVEGGKLVVQEGDRILIDPKGKVELPPALGTLRLRPTLSWVVEAPRPYRGKAELTYLTQGISWEADYILALSPDEEAASLDGWITLTNNSGASYLGAKVKLVAGEVSRARPPYEVMRGMAAEAKAAPQVKEEGFFEYHLYTLKRPTDILDRQQKQVKLLSAPRVKVRKEYLLQRSGDVAVTVIFTNSDEAGLGLPLPKGKVKVMKQDSSGSLQLVGEDWIQHTPKDETVRLRVGTAFDIKGTVTLTEQKKLSKDVWRYSYRVEVRNHKDQPVVVKYRHYVSYNFEILKESLPHKKVENNQVEWDIPVPANGKKVLTFTYIQGEGVGRVLIAP